MKSDRGQGPAPGRNGGETRVLESRLFTHSLFDMASLLPQSTVIRNRLPRGVGPPAHVRLETPMSVRIPQMDRSKIGSSPLNASTWGYGETVTVDSPPMTPDDGRLSRRSMVVGQAMVCTLKLCDLAMCASKAGKPGSLRTLDILRVWRKRWRRSPLLTELQCSSQPTEDE